LNKWQLPALDGSRNSRGWDFSWNVFSAGDLGHRPPMKLRTGLQRIVSNYVPEFIVDVRGFSATSWSAATAQHAEMLLLHVFYKGTGSSTWFFPVIQKR